MKLYCGYDKVRESVFTVFGANTDGEAVRNNMLGFLRVLPRDDIEIWQVGTFGDKPDGFFVLSDPRRVDIDKAYKLPEDLVKNVSASRDADIKAMQKIADDAVSARDLTDLSN